MAPQPAKLTVQEDDRMTITKRGRKMVVTMRRGDESLAFDGGKMRLEYDEAAGYIGAIKSFCLQALNVPKGMSLLPDLDQPNQRIYRFTKLSN